MKLDKKQSEALQSYLSLVYDTADRERRCRCGYYNDIMRTLHGDVDYSQDAADERRAEAEKRGLLTALPDQLLRLGDASLRELSNDLVSIMMPVDTPYAAVPGDPTQKDKVAGMLAVCRAYAAYNMHRGNAIDATYNWLALQGAIIHGKFEGEGERPQDSEFSGVVFYSKDPYACFWDVGTKLIHASRKAAIMGWHEKVSPMEIYMDAAREEDYILPVKASKGKSAKTPTHNLVTISEGVDYQRSYRKDYKPDEAVSGSSYDTGVTAYDLVSAFSGNVHEQTGAVTRTTMYLRIPKEVLGKDLNSYKLTFVGPQLVHIVEVGPGIESFPVIGGAPFMEHDQTSYQSYGEHASAMNRVASAQFNLTKRGMRREAVGGTTLIDKKILGGRNVSELESESARFVEISVPTSADGESDIRKSLATIGAEGATSRLSELQGFAEFYSSMMFPRSARGDVANLDRATAMHAMLAAGSADGSLISLAILLDETIGVPMRRLLKRLILQHKGVIRVVDPKMRKFVDMSVEDLRNLEFEFTSSQPIAGFDRHRVLLTLEQMMNYLIQTPQIQQNPQRIEGMLDYMMYVSSGGTVSLTDFDLALGGEQPAPQPTTNDTGAENVVLP